MRALIEKLNNLNARLHKSKEGFSYYTLENEENFLEWCCLNDYILHGSTKAINEELKPSQANCSLKEFGNQKAIYMTDIPLIAIFCAFTSGAEVGLRQDYKKTIIENNKFTYQDVFLSVAKPENISNEGYIYIFNKEQTDAHTDAEYVSYKEILPLIVIKIKREVLKYPIKTLKEERIL